MRNPIELGVKAREVNYRLQTALSGAESRVEKMLAGVMRSRRQEERNSPQSRRQRREAAQAVMGPADQREMREIFEENPEEVMQILQLPNPDTVEAGFHRLAKKTPAGYNPDFSVPLAERELGVIEFDPRDKRIKALQAKLGIDIRQRILTDPQGNPVQVWDWVRPEEDGFRKLTGPPVLDRVEDKDGSLRPPAGYRTVEVPNIAGAFSRLALKQMISLLGEDPKNRRVRGIIRELEIVAEKTGEYVNPAIVADIFGLSRVYPDLSGKQVFDRWMESHSPKINP